jgi:hypothetical protein
MEQDAEQLAQQDQGEGHCGGRGQHLSATRWLVAGSSGAVMRRKGTSASLGPMPISSTRKVSITPAAVTADCSMAGVCTNQGRRAWPAEDFLAALPG